MENTNDKFHRKLRRIRSKAKYGLGLDRMFRKERGKKEKRITGKKKKKKVEG